MIVEKAGRGKNSEKIRRDREIERGRANDLHGWGTEAASLL